VKDAAGEPVAFTNVYIKDTRLGTQSDLEGNFFLRVAPGKCTLCATTIGYASHEQEIEIKQHEHKSIQIQLEEKTNKLDEVVVEAKSPVQRVKESAYNVVAIDAKALQNTTLDLAHAMEKVSGVRIRESGGLGSNMQFSLNGFTGKHVKFFMDGVPMEGMGASFRINNIPVHLAERIEIYKGVVPVGFGSDAIGGAVNIVTARRKRTYIDASYSYGSFNTHRTSVSAGHTAKNGLMVELIAYQNYSDNTFYIDNAVRDLATMGIDNSKIEHVKRFHDTYHNETVILKAGLVNKRFADRLVFSVNLGQSYKEMQNGVRQDIVYGQKHSKTRTVMPSAQYIKRNLFVSGLDLMLTANLNKNVSHNIDTSAYIYNWRGESKYGGGKLGEQSHQNSKYDNKNWNATFNATYRVNDRQSLTLNNVLASFDRNTRATAFDASSFSATDTMPKVSRKNVSGLSYKFNRDGKWNVSIFGKHYRQYAKGPKSSADGRSYLLAEESFSATGYGIVGTVFFLKDFQAKLSYEKAYRLPTESELFGDEDLEHGSAGLKAENSDNYNLNLSFNKEISRKHFIYADAGLILRNTKDYIRRVTEAVSNKYFATHINHGYVRNTGVNGELRYTYAHLVSTGVNVTYQNIRDNEKQTMSSAQSTTYKVRIPNIPYFFANGDAELRLQHFLRKGNHLNIGYAVNYVHEFSLYFENLGSSSSKHVVPSQLSHDLSAAYIIADGRYNVALEGRNLANAKLYDNFSLQKPGRAFYVKFRYLYK
jgi:outer membrane cobalamin receptor